MDKFDSYMEDWAAPLPPDPRPTPESVPMEKTEIIDLATEAEKPKNYLNEGEQKPFEKLKEEGFSMAPPLDVYEPGFRTDLYKAIKGYFKDKKATREKLQAIREKTGIGRYRTWMPEENQ